MSSIINWFKDLINTFLKTLENVLPLSPFVKYYNFWDGVFDSDYLAYLNWFVPVGECLAILSAFLAILAIYYIYSIIARWVKAIQ